jgi:hypothetical protein
MKTLTKIFCISVILLGFSAASFAQVTESALASATIVAPIAISKTVDMNFGNVASSAGAGTVVLTPAGTRSVTPGVTLPATIGTVTAASFTVTGTANYTYSITLPSTATTITSGTDNMTVDTFTSSPTPTGTLNGVGTQTLTVGATLNVGVSQPAGIYVSGTPFDVTVNYN